jgi:SAM-dependent methyltransferase
MKTTGFRSFTYRSGHIYNWVNQRLYEWKKKFAILGKLIGYSNETSLKVLELACGTGYVTRYLHPSVEYEGWDLNPAFIKKLLLDKRKGRLKPKKIVIKQKNIFDFNDYPKEKKDIILFSGILHHIYPKHADLVENAKKHAKRIVMCEPYAIHPKDIEAADWTARMAIYFTKHLPARIYKWIDIFLADNDGINSYRTRSAWEYDKKGLGDWYKSIGVSKIYTLQDELIGIWKEGD